MDRQNAQQFGLGLGKYVLVPMLIFIIAALAIWG